MTHSHPNRRFVPQAVLTRSRKINTAGVSVNTDVRPVNIAGSKPTVNHPRPISNAYKKGYSHVTRPFNKYSEYKNSIFNKKVNTVRVKDTTARDRVVVSKNKGKGVNVVKASACWVWKAKIVGNPQQKEYKEKGVIDSGCSRYMTGNKCYLTEYEDYDGGFVSFGDGKVLLRVPRKDNIYSVDLKSVVPTKGLTCLFAKATIDESNLWHRRLGHINFKNINKLVKGNLVRGLPSKIFENNHSCVACQKGKQHKASLNRTLIEAARTMLVDSKLPTTFWAEVVNTACNVLNRVLVIKPHNKTPYELIHVRTPLIDFMKPFGCPVTILNPKDHLGKFDGNANKGFFVGYSIVSKAMRIFNKRTKIVEETLNIRFLKSTPNVIGNGPDWLFDVDSLTISMNYVPVVAGNQTNGIARTKDIIVTGQAEKQIEHEQDTNSINTVSTPVSAAGPSFTNDDPSSPINAAEASNAFKEHLFERFSPFKNAFTLLPISNVTPMDNTRIFGNAYDDEDVGAEADLNNLETTMNVSPIPTTRIDKDHPKD
ncbi:ribonuclease H-like domain-containing protein [Tanacetum coccineum]